MSVERRRRGVLGLVVDDPFRKLVAVGLAVLLWFFIDSRIMDSKTLTLPLRAGDQQREQESRRDSSELVVYLPTGRVEAGRFLDGDRVLTNIEVKFSGPRYKINALTENPPRLQVMTFLNRQWNRAIANAPGGDTVAGTESDTEIVEFTAADIQRDIRRDDLTIELVPPRVRLEVQIRDNFMFAVTNDMVDFGPLQNTGRLRMEQASYLPRQITLVGPAIGISKLRNKTKRFRAELDYAPLDQEVRALLTVIDGSALDVHPEDNTYVTIPLDAERKSYVLTLPLSVYDRRLDKSIKYETEESSRAVTLSFSGRLGRELQGSSKDSRQAWAERNVRLEVYLYEITGATYGPQFQLPPFLVLDGPVLQQYPNNEYLLEDSVTVTVRRKK